jgi:hypothetical protein
VVSRGVVEEPISAELVLVDEALGRRARAALPDPPWLLPALAEPRLRPPSEPPAATVLEFPARPPVRPPAGRRRPTARSLLLVAVALACAGLLALAFVPLSRGPSLGTAKVEQAAPAVPVRPPAVSRPKVVTKAKPPRPQRPAAKPKKTRQSEHARAKTRTRRRTPKPAAPARPRALTRAERVLAWRRYPAALYYAVYLQRGAKTLFQTRSLRPGTVLPTRLTLRPGTYHVVVRPAIPGDAGIILGSAIFRKTMRL